MKVLRKTYKKTKFCVHPLRKGDDGMWALQDLPASQPPQTEVK